MVNPGKTYPRALLACVFLVILCNALPILVGTGSSAVAAAAADSGGGGRWSLWVDGYFADVATAIAGRWLGVWVVMAAAAANIGLFEAEMSSDAFQLMGMVSCYFITALFTPPQSYMLRNVVQRSLEHCLQPVLIFLLQFR